MIYLLLLVIWRKFSLSADIVNHLPAVTEKMNKFTSRIIYDEGSRMNCAIGRKKQSWSRVYFMHTE